MFTKKLDLCSAATFTAAAAALMLNACGYDAVRNNAAQQQVAPAKVVTTPGPQMPTTTTTAQAPSGLPTNATGDVDSNNSSDGTCYETVCGYHDVVVGCNVYRIYGSYRKKVSCCDGCGTAGTESRRHKYRYSGNSNYSSDNSGGTAVANSDVDQILYGHHSDNSDVGGSANNYADDPSAGRGAPTGTGQNEKEGKLLAMNNDLSVQQNLAAPDVINQAKKATNPNVKEFVVTGPDAVELFNTSQEIANLTHATATGDITYTKTGYNVECILDSGTVTLPADKPIVAADGSNVICTYRIDVTNGVAQVKNDHKTGFTNNAAINSASATASETGKSANQVQEKVLQFSGSVASEILSSLFNNRTASAKILSHPVVEKESGGLITRTEEHFKIDTKKSLAAKWGNKISDKEAESAGFFEISVGNTKCWRIGDGRKKSAVYGCALILKEDSGQFSSARSFTEQQVVDRVAQKPAGANDDGNDNGEE